MTGQGPVSPREILGQRFHLETHGVAPSAVNERGFLLEFVGPLLLYACVGQWGRTSRCPPQPPRLVRFGGVGGRGGAVACTPPIPLFGVGVVGLVGGRLRAPPMTRVAPVRGGTV